MKQEAAAIEHHPCDAGGLGALGDPPADVLRGGDGRAGRGARVLLQRRGGGHGAALAVEDDLRIDVAARTVDRQAGAAAGIAPDRRADALGALGEGVESRHGLFLLAFFAEDILAAILYALALLGLGLAPAAGLGGGPAALFAGHPPKPHGG